MLKRLTDILLAIAALIAFSPLLVPVALILRLTGEGEVFYGQQRVGRQGRLFKIIKFATMVKNSEDLPGGDITVGNDPRVLPFGRFLRDTKINELPQLLNVLFGDMSIIGYRPLTPRVVALFPPEHWGQLASLRPGLSGIGSIVFRDEETLLDGVADRLAAYAVGIVPYKAALEGWYAERQGFVVDAKLILITILAVIRARPDPDLWFDDLPPVPADLAALRARQVPPEAVAVSAE